jgi:galactitol PTS system EIIA component
MHKDTKHGITIEGLEVQEENIRIGLKASCATEVIQVLGQLLHENGYVKDTFIHACIEREAVFPTGLQSSSLGFAIPHTDTEHVIKPALAVAALEKPVLFKAMGTEDTEVQVEVVIMLAVSDPGSMVNVLRSVISIAQNEPVLLAVHKAQSEKEVVNLIDQHIRTTIGKMKAQSLINYSQ